MALSLLSVLILVWPTAALAADDALTHLFEKTFYTHYERGACGDNIVNFVERARKKKVDLDQAYIVEFENKGLSISGYLNAEWAREGGARNPDFPHSGLYFLAGERNWSHHYVLENQGVIYDFDFGNEPVVLPVRDYLEQMFLIEDALTENSIDFVGREKKLEEYAASLRPAMKTATAYLEGYSLPKPKVQKLSEYLEDHP